MLLHVVLSREGFAACRAVDILLTGMFLTMPSGMAGCCKGIGATVGLRVRTWVLLL